MKKWIKRVARRKKQKSNNDMNLFLIKYFSTECEWCLNTIGNCKCPTHQLCLVCFSCSAKSECSCEKCNCNDEVI